MWTVGPVIEGMKSIINAIIITLEVFTSHSNTHLRGHTVIDLDMRTIHFINQIYCLLSHQHWMTYDHVDQWETISWKRIEQKEPSRECTLFLLFGWALTLRVHLSVSMKDGTEFRRGNSGIKDEWLSYEEGGWGFILKVSLHPRRRSVGWAAKGFPRGWETWRLELLLIWRRLLGKAELCLNCNIVNPNVYSAWSSLW